jgi:2-polyprenyl-6-methoxyphenol hydroxylase-like FAD-dependent oxidoreductase
MRVAIQGAGVAGPALAYWLERSGHEILLIEQAPQFRTGGYIIDFWGVGYDIAEKMGILPAVLEAGYQVRELRIVDDRNRKIAGFATSLFRKATHDRMTSLPRGDLAHAVYQAISDRIETTFTNSITALDEHDSGIVASFQQGDDREFDLVIGADGLHSGVRKLVFGPEGQFEKQLGYNVAAFNVSGYRPHEDLVYVSYAIPGRQVSRFAMRGDRTLILFVFASQFLAGEEPRDGHQRKRAVHEIFADAGWECPQILAAMDDLDDIYFDRVSQIRMPRWSQGRVALLGDAAACVSLMAGEGTGLALTEAYILAGELARAGGDYTKAFACYEERLRPLLATKQKSAAKFASAFAPRTRFGLWFRNQMTRLMQLPGVAWYFIGRNLRDDFELPDYEM